MKKSEGFDLLMQFPNARRMFCYNSLQVIHKNSELFDDLGFICLCENDHNEMVYKIGSWIKNSLLIHFGLDWMPGPFRKSAYDGLMLLMRLGIDKPEIQRACGVLSDKYRDYEWKDIFAEEFSNEWVLATVIFPVQSKLLFLNPLMTPTDRNNFYFRFDKGQVLETLQEYLTPLLGVYPIDTDQSQRSLYYGLFETKANKSIKAAACFMELEEIVYEFLLSIIRFHDFKIIKQQFRSDVPPEKTVVQTATRLRSIYPIYVHYRDNLLDIGPDVPEIGLELGECRMPMYVF